MGGVANRGRSDYIRDRAATRHDRVFAPGTLVPHLLASVCQVVRQKPT